MTTPAQTLELLLEAGQALSSTLDLGELLTTVLKLGAKVVNAETASILLLDDKSKELYFDVALGLGEEASKVRLKMGQGIAGTVASERKPCIINDVKQDARWSPATDKRSGFVTRSILAVPVMIRGRLIGVLEAINKQGGGFGESDLHAFEAFASQAAVAIDNARLFSSLLEERFRLHTVFSQMTDGAVLADDKGGILISNEAARKCLAVGETTLSSLTESLKELSVKPDLPTLLAGETPAQVFEAVRENPKKLILAGTATRIALGAGQKEGGAGKALVDTGWLWVFRDVTESKLKEGLKRTFLSLISHKLKTPLVSIIGYSDILQSNFKDKPGEEVSAKAAGAILTQGKKLSELVDKLLKYTTLEDTQATVVYEPCPVDAIIGEALKVMKDWLAERKAKVEYAATTMVVVGDKSQLVEVFKNLLENAVKFDAKPEKTVRVSTTTGAGMGRIAVADTGPGIPPEDQDKILSQFHQIEASFTGQIHGWGLGLPFVHKVIEQHRGQMVFESKLGSGTTVTVLLPLGRAA